MPEDVVESLGPVLYAVYKSVLTYRESYKKATEAYKKLTGNEVASEKEIFSKIFDVVTKEFNESPEILPEEFLKKYQQFYYLFSMAKKILG
ncbi:MAG: hypothetical protein ACTSV6_07430 [Candidatus Heimdallarchaeota archaeon]